MLMGGKEKKNFNKWRTKNVNEISEESEKSEIESQTHLEEN